jgi:small subunit ribosomal protein S1
MLANENDVTLQDTSQEEIKQEEQVTETTAPADEKVEEVVESVEEPEPEVPQKEETKEVEPEAEVQQAEETADAETEETVKPKRTSKKAAAVTEEPTPVVEESVAEEKKEEAEKPAPKPKKEKAEPKPAVKDKAQDELMALYEETFSNYKPGQIVEGTVISVTDKEVLVDIGFKSEGAIPISEFTYSGTPERNTLIKVFINDIEDGEGKLKLSKKKADFFTNLAIMREMYKKNETVTGILRRRVKGGMIAEVLGLEAFLPGSQISLKPIPNLDQFIGKESTFKIIKLDEERRNIIVSRKRVLEEEQVEKKQHLMEKIQLNAELDGEVKNITNYGAFIDLGGVDGLLHITDMSWGRINHPSEMLNIGDKVKVKVIGYDEENGRVSLGLKQLVPHPWENIEIKYPEGNKVTGKVVNVTQYGAFVELEPGVEGLVHVSEMSWTKKITNPSKIVRVGESISAIVLAVDKENHRISLGMKQMEANPWLTIEERYPEGTLLARKIKSITNFGVFVEIEDGIDGLVHISDISWTKRIYHPKEIFRKNQEIKAVVLSVDKTLHRVALGVKQLHSDPWVELDALLPLNSEVKGSISKLIPKGVLVDVPIGDANVEGFVPISHLAIPKLDKPELAFELGEELPLKVIELDMDNRRLILSVKAFFFSRDKRLQDEYINIHEAKMAEKVKVIPETVEESEEEKAAHEAIISHYGYADDTAEQVEAPDSTIKTAFEEAPMEVTEPVKVSEPEETSAEVEETVEEAVAAVKEVTEITETEEIVADVKPKAKKAAAPKKEKVEKTEKTEKAPKKEKAVKAVKAEEKTE